MNFLSYGRPWDTSFEGAVWVDSLTARDQEHSTHNAQMAAVVIRTEGSDVVVLWRIRRNPSAP